MNQAVAMKDRQILRFGGGPNRMDPGMRVFRDTAHVIAALSPDHPVYCFARSELRSRARYFLEEFPGETAFAVKANAHECIIRTLVESGLQVFDVASLSEIELVHRLAPQAIMLYDNPVKSRDEIRRAYGEFGVRSFALDDMVEFEKINAIVGADPSVQLSVRFKLAKRMPAQDLSSKFGASRDAAIGLLRRVADAGYRPALTFHPGSQCTDPRAYEEYIDAAAAIAASAGVQLTMLNVGGGFPAPYRNTDVPEMDVYFSAIGTAFSRNFDAAQCRLMCEPGRGMVATAVSLLTRVKHRRAGHVLYLNDGIYGGLLEQLMFKVATPVRAFRDGLHLDGRACDFEVFGPTCDSTDRLPLPVPLPAETTEGDWVEFALMGAYGSATATRFNGFQSDFYVEVLEGFTGDDDL